MSAVPKWLLVQINGVYQAGQEGGELFFFPPCVLSESPAISLALQMKMIGRLCSRDGRQDLYPWLSSGTELWAGHYTLRMMSFPPYISSVGWTTREVESLN